ncbi:MAG: DUF885 domain-containing protein, partial [Thermoanaerobaculia bacterium]
MRRLTTTAILLALAALPAAAGDYATQRSAILERVDALAANAGAEPASDRLADFIQIYFDYAMNEFPEFATYIGHPGDHGRWTDNSQAAEELRDADLRRAVEVLQTIPREELSGADRLNYDLLAEDLPEQVEGQRFPEELLPITQLSGVQQQPAQLFAMMPTGSVTEVENILSRLAGIPSLVANDIDALRRGLAAGVTPPQVTLRDLPGQVEALTPDDPMASALLMPFAKLPEATPEAERERLRAAAVATYTESVAPAYRELHEFLVEEYLPGARQTIAASALPDGEAWYAYQVQQMTTTDLTPQQIHELGLSEVARIRAEMDRVIVESGFSGDFAAFTTFLRTDPQFYYTKPEELLAGYRDISKRADPELIKLFGTLPRLPYGVTPVPDFMAPSQTTAYYEPGSLEAGRPGQFFANTYKLDERPKWEMEALTLHEAVPGHHLQTSLQQELHGLPSFRRHDYVNAFGEGWGLYSERLGLEAGFYKDSYSNFGRLTYEMWRACRLVVD